MKFLMVPATTLSVLLFAASLDCAQPSSLQKLPPSLPVATVVFSQVATGSLTVANALTTPCFASYQALQQQLNATALDIKALLTQVANKTVTPLSAANQFSIAQTNLANYSGNYQQNSL